MTLTTRKINNAKPGVAADGRITTKPYKLGDSGGLYFEVSPTGGKWWRLKYRFGGKEKRLSLGVYPGVSLTEARKRRNTFRALLADGIDPIEHAKKERTTERANKASEIAANRLMLDSNGALSLRFGNRRLILSPTQTAELREFLDATRGVTPKVTLCR